MRHRFGRLLLFPLLLIVVSLPLRWGHSHEGMTGQQLSLHLQQFHPPLQNQSLPAGWHSHPLFPGIVQEKCSHPFVLDILPENRVQISVEKEQSDLETVDSGILEREASNRQFSCFFHEVRIHADQHAQIYLQLQVLLI
ncbi:hypothetical protein [Gimesia sp.]|uniref:hypothetical protein n=1 Tax=Gimesia sp. TaxID=2024833 RepID=UPI003A8DF7DC